MQISLQCTIKMFSKQCSTSAWSCVLWSLYWVQILFLMNKIWESFLQKPGSVVRGCPGKKVSIIRQGKPWCNTFKCKMFQTFNRENTDWNLQSCQFYQNHCNILRMGWVHEARRDWVRAKVNLIYTFCSQLKSLEYVIILLHYFIALADEALQQVDGCGVQELRAVCDPRNLWNWIWHFSFVFFIFLSYFIS